MKILSTLALSVLLLVSCNSQSGERGPTITPEIVIENSKSLTEYGKEIKNIELIQNRKTLGNSQINEFGEILVSEETKKDSKVFILNVETNKYKEIISESPLFTYGEAFQDEDIFVFFSYYIGGESANPETIFIYHRESGKLSRFNPEKLWDGEHKTELDNQIVRIDNEIYFETQDRERQDYTDYIDNGLSIYKFNIYTEEIEYVVEGMSPRNINNQLHIIENNNNGLGSLINFTTKKEIVSNITNSASYNDIIVYSRFEDEVTKTYKYVDGEETFLFERPSGYSFWNYKLNNKFLTWHQTSGYVYMYDLEEQVFVQLTDYVESNYSRISEKYLFWNENIYNLKDKDDIIQVIYFVEV